MASLPMSVLQLLYSGKWYIVSILGVLYLWQAYRLYRRLSHINGPWLAQWSQLWLLGAIYRQNTHLEVYKLSKKYGVLHA